MPLYEYQCKKCKHRFERIQKFSDRMVRKCPDCGGPVEQMISAPAVQFKGSGWYVTDYASKKNTSESSSSEKAEKAENAEKAEKSEKAEKAEKAERSERAEKSDHSGDTDKKESKARKTESKKSKET